MARGRVRTYPGPRAAGAGAPRGRGRGGAFGRPAPLPWDAKAQQEAATIGNEGADARALIAANFASAQNKLGFGAGDENPYSDLAENRQNYDSNRRGITNGAGNQLYAGSTINRQSAARSAYDKRQKAIEDSIAEAESDYNTGAAKATRDEQTGMLGARAGAVERAAQAEPAPLAPGRPRGGRGRVGGRPTIRRRFVARGRVR